MTKTKRILSVMLSALMLVFTCMTYVPASAAEVTANAPEVAFVGVDHSPLVVGDTETFSFATKNADKVSYKAVLKDAKGTAIEDVTNGYTAAVDGNIPYAVKAKTVFAAGKYTLAVSAKRVSDGKEVTYTANLNCVSKDDANRVYANGDMVIDKTTVTAGDKITISGIKDLGGITGPYKFKLHTYNSTTGVWTKNVVANYGDKIEWTPTEAGTYVLDVYVNTEKSTTWAKYLKNPTSDDVYGTYEAWKLQVVTVNPKPTDLKVDSINALNRVEFEVKFNQPVDGDSIDLSNIYYDGVALNGDRTPIADSATLSADKTSMIVYMPANVASQQSNHKISISGIKSAAGKEMTEVKNQEVKFVDLAIPSITSVTATGNKKLTVKFSEAMSPSYAASLIYSNYRIDGKVMVGDATKTPAINGRELTLYLGSALADGAHKFSFKPDTVADYNGYTVVPTDNDFTVVADSAKPTVTLDSVQDQQNIKLRFSEEVTKTEVYWMDGTVKRTAASVTQVSTDKTLYKVNFATGNRLPLTATNVYVEKSVDFSGNVIDKATLAVTAVADVTRPTVTSVVPEKDNEEGALIVQFSEKISDTSARLYGNIVVKDSTGTEVSVSKNYNTDSTGTALKDQIRLVGTFTADTYTVTVKNVDDISIQANKSLEQSFTVTTPDVTAPSLSSSNFSSATKVILVFSEAMDTTTITDLANYQMEAATDVWVSLPSATDIEVSNSGKVVTLTFPASFKVAGATVTNVGTYFAGTKKILVRNLKDLAGNALAVQSKLVSAISEVAAELQTAKATGKNSIRVQLDTTNVLPSEVYAGDFVVKAGLVTLTPTGASLDKDNARINLTIAEDLNADGTYTVGTTHTAVTVELASPVVITKTALGNPITNLVGGPATATDGIKSTITVPSTGALTVNSNVVTVSFDETIAAITSGSVEASMFKVRDADATVLREGVDYTLTATGLDNNVTITLIKAYTGTLTVELLGNTCVYDSTGTNKINDFAAIATDNSVANPGLSTGVTVTFTAVAGGNSTPTIAGLTGGNTLVVKAGYNDAVIGATVSGTTAITTATQFAAVAGPLTVYELDSALKVVGYKVVTLN